jgi:hypothetical protein
LAKLPFLTCDDKVICGSAILIVDTGSEGLDFTPITMELPTKSTPAEFMCFLFLITSVFGAEHFAHLQTCVVNLRAGQFYSEPLHGLHFFAFAHTECFVITVQRCSGRNLIENKCAT